MNILGVTLARGGSKGVPHKNIREICGKPLLAYTVEEALKSTLITEYVVSSDDTKILELASRLGALTIRRPDHLSKDTTPHQPALLHALMEAEKECLCCFDVVVDLRCTNPFKTVEDIDGAIQKLLDTGADVVVGVSKLEDHHPSRIKMIINDRLVDVWPEPVSGRRQDLKPDVYIRNGSVYVVKSEILRMGKFFIGLENIRPWVMPEWKGLNIDTEIDIMVAEVIFNDAS